MTESSQDSKSADVAPQQGLVSSVVCARMVGLSRPSIVKRLREGQLRGTRIGSRWYVDRLDAERLALAQRST